MHFFIFMSCQVFVFGDLFSTVGNHSGVRLIYFSKKKIPKMVSTKDMSTEPYERVQGLQETPSRVRTSQTRNNRSNTYLKKCFSNSCRVPENAV